jgi:hypothetical protein
VFVSKRTKEFRALFAALPADAKRQARDAYRLFTQNPRHPSLQFKRISPADPTLYSARVGSHYRVLGKMKGDVVTWDWIGSHEAYNNLIH